MSAEPGNFGSGVPLRIRRSRSSRSRRPRRVRGARRLAVRDPGVLRPRRSRSPNSPTASGTARRRPTFTGDLELAAAIAPRPDRGPHGPCSCTPTASTTFAWANVPRGVPGTFGSPRSRSMQIVLPGGGVAPTPLQPVPRAADHDPRQRHDPFARVQPAEPRARRDRGVDPDAGPLTPHEEVDAPGVAAVAGIVLGAVVTISVQGGAIAPRDAHCSARDPIAPPSATFLAWVPKGLPAGFAEAVRALPETGPVTTVAEDHAWLTRSWDADGLPRRPDIGALSDPARHDRRRSGVLRGVPSTLRTAASRAGCTTDDGVLSATSATLRGLGPGASLRFSGGHTVTIEAVLPDRRWVGQS